MHDCAFNSQCKYWSSFNGKDYEIKSSKRKYWNIGDSNHSTRAINRSFYPILRCDHLETLLTIHRPKEFCQLGRCAGPSCSVPNINALKGPSYYLQSIMIQFQICYQSHLHVSYKTKITQISGAKPGSDPLQSSTSRVLFYPISNMPQISTDG